MVMISSGRVFVCVEWTDDRGDQKKIWTFELEARDESVTKVA